MTSSCNHQFFKSPCRVSQPLRNDRCQTILYKAVFEHFKEIKDIAALLLASKSFQNSSFGADYLVDSVVSEDSIALLDSLISPSSCFSLQFVPSLHIIQSWIRPAKINRRISHFVSELVNTKYLRLSLRSLTLVDIPKEVLSELFAANNAWPQLLFLKVENSELNDDVLQMLSKNAVQLRTVIMPMNPRINDTQITDAGLEHISVLSRITSLDLSFRNLITHVGYRHISKLSAITSLNLHDCRMLTDVGLAHISQIRGIKSLDVSCCYWITDAGLEHVSKITSITSLNLTYCRITDEGVRHVSKLFRITSLHLYNCSITDLGLAHLSKLESITALNLTSGNGNTSVITDAGLKHLSKCSNLTFLDLSRSGKITDSGLEHLSTLSEITSLNLSGCKNITGAGLEHFSKLLNITSLNLSECHWIKDVGLQHVSRLSTITSLDLSNCRSFGEAAVCRVATLPFLSFLNIYNCLSNYSDPTAGPTLREALPKSIVIHDH